MKKEIFRLANILFGGQKSETPVPAGVPESEVYGGLPVSNSVSTNGFRGNKFQILPEYEPRGKTTFAKHLKFKLSVQQPQAEYIDVTPEMAEEMLKYNSVEGCPPNRPCNRQTVAKYARLMQKSMWGAGGNGTSEPIIFSDKRRLLSGQHRLEAVRLSGVTQRFLVVFGEPDENFAYIDQGRRRSNQDVFAMHGVPYYSLMSAATAWVVAYDNDAIGLGARDYGSAEELYKAYLQHPRLQDSVPIGRAFAESKLAPPAVMTAMHYICARKNRGEADQFFSQVATGIGITKKKSPADGLRKRLIDNYGSSAKLNSQLIAAFTIKSWNAHRAGLKAPLLKWRTEQSPNEPFPKAN